MPINIIDTNYYSHFYHKICDILLLDKLMLIFHLAYEILSDEDKRRKYDQFGEAAFTQGGGDSGSSFDGFQHFGDFHKFFQDSNMFFSNHHFGGGASGGRQRGRSTFDFDEFLGGAGGAGGDAGGGGGFDDMFGDMFNFGGFGDGMHHHNQYRQHHQHPGHAFQGLSSLLIIFLLYIC